MKYGIIVSLLCPNGLFAHNLHTNTLELKDYILQNQAKFEREVRAEKKDNDEQAKKLSDGLDTMIRIVAALNKKMCVIKKQHN